MHERIEKTEKVVGRFTAWLNKLYLAAACVCLVAIVVTMFVQVFTRYIMGASLTGTEELGRYFFVWMNMLGAGLCVNKVSNATISVLNDALKGAAKRIHSIAVEFMIAVMAGILIVYGIRIVEVAMGQITPATHLPMSLIYMSIVVGSIGIAVNAINNILRRLEGAL